MSIQLHCPKCQKLIKAPDNAGGRHGKCPYCKAAVYIPEPMTDDDIIPIAPIDKEAEEKDAELRRESIRYTTTLEHATDRAAEAAADDGPADSPVEDDVEAYVQAIHASKLRVAQNAVTRLKRHSDKACAYIESQIESESAGAFKGIPPPLVKGFLRKLLGELK